MMGRYLFVGSIDEADSDDRVAQAGNPSIQSVLSAFTNKCWFNVTGQILAKSNCSDLIDQLITCALFRVPTLLNRR